MIFCYTYRSMSSPVVTREVISNQLLSDTETHSQTLGRVRGTAQKMGKKNCRSQSVSKDTRRIQPKELIDHRD